MNKPFQIIHTVSEKERNENPAWNMPYVPGIKVLSGKPLYISGVNAAPIYHSHPHQPYEFDSLDFSPEAQAKQTMKNLCAILDSAGGKVDDIVQLILFIVDIKKYGDPIGKVVASYFNHHLPTSTVVGVSELITDQRLILEITATAYINE